MDEFYNWLYGSTRNNQDIKLIPYQMLIGYMINFLNEKGINFNLENELRSDLIFNRLKCVINSSMMFK